jgi:hypothetical protein
MMSARVSEAAFLGYALMPFLFERIDCQCRNGSHETVSRQTIYVRTLSLRQPGQR